jgi:zinc protease
MREFYQEMLNQISQFGNADYFTQDQIATAQEVIRRNKIRNSEKPSSLASQLTYQWCSTSLEYFTDYTDACMTVCKEDLQNYAKKYLVDKFSISGMIISPDMNKRYSPINYFR